MKRIKIGRNDTCPCGSGLKYKKCHGGVRPASSFKSETVDPIIFNNLPIAVQEQIKEQELKAAKRKKLYGEVRPTISADFQGHKFVAVGNRLHYSKKWKTFHDFLFDYIKNCLGSEWGNFELQKDFEERHPILQWYKLLCDFQRKHIEKEGEIFSAVCTGAVGAYLSLAYDLYVLRHHSLLQGHLVNRLKDPRQFQGARYEIFVTASFVKAGFDIELEDESDKTKSHCEFVATFKALGKKYSVEAKSRHRPGLLGQQGPRRSDDEIRLRIGNLLRNALKKEADHTRIVFIDINMPPEEGGPFERRWFKGLMNEVSKVEKEDLDNKPAQPAYLVFTNHPYHYVGNDEQEPGKNFLMTAINMEHFKINVPEIARASDPPVFKLWESINTHTKVPNDFDE
jgi:uncharacterized protein YchJ